MWTAIYTNIDTSGLNPELKVTVNFSNDQDDTIYEKTYAVLPSDLNSNFPIIVQEQIDILNSKNAAQKQNLGALIGTPVSTTPIGNQVAQPLTP